MAEHYFTREPTSKHKPYQLKTVLRGKEYLFRTDAGVFARKHLDPGTKLLIESLDLSGVKAPLDLGCGYGPIGLVMARELPEATVCMSDPNRRAVELALTNAALNGLENLMIREGEYFSPWPEKTFDLIATNPPLRAGKEIILRLFQEAMEHLLPGGTMWTVIRTSQGAKSYIREMEKIFGAAEVVEIKGGYRVIRTGEIFAS